MTVKDLKSTIRDVVDFPSKGIVFRDLTTLIKDGEALHVMSSALRELYADKGVTLSLIHISEPTRRSV